MQYSVRLGTTVSLAGQKKHDNHKYVDEILAFSMDYLIINLYNSASLHDTKVSPSSWLCGLGSPPPYQSPSPSRGIWVWVWAQGTGAQGHRGTGYRGIGV